MLLVSKDYLDLLIPKLSILHTDIRVVPQISQFHDFEYNFWNIVIGKERTSKIFNYKYNKCTT